MIRLSRSYDVISNDYQYEVTELPTLSFVHTTYFICTILLGII